MPTASAAPQAAAGKSKVKRHVRRKTSVAAAKAPSSSGKEVARHVPGTELAERRPSGISDQWFEAAYSGQETAFGAIRKFVDLVDSTVPVIGGDSSRRRKLVEGAIDVADLAARTPLGLMRGAVQNAVLVNVGFDVDVNVDTDVDAFTGVDVGVDVAVPTDVGAFKNKGDSKL